MATRWGVVSTGSICSDFTKCLKILPRSEHRLVAVAARQLDKAQKFASEFGFEKAYGDYQQLAKDPDVEVVYIGSIHTTHFEVGKMMIEAGKNVLVEKPMTLTPKHTKELVRLARSHNVFLMEAVWSRFTPAYQHLDEIIKKGTLGKIVQTTSTFGVKINEVARLKHKELGGGATLDIGIYGIQFALFAFQGRSLEKMVAAGHLNSQGVDESVTLTLLFNDGGTATITTSATCECVNEAYVCGTEATYKVCAPFWTPTDTVFNEKQNQFPLKDEGYQFNYLNSQNLIYEAKAVREALVNGWKEHPKMPLNESIQIADIMQETMKQIGIQY